MSAGPLWRGASPGTEAPCRAPRTPRRGGWAPGAATSAVGGAAGVEGAGTRTRAVAEVEIDITADGEVPEAVETGRGGSGAASGPAILTDTSSSAKDAPPPTPAGCAGYTTVPAGDADADMMAADAASEARGRMESSGRASGRPTGAAVAAEGLAVPDKRLELRGWVGEGWLGTTTGGSAAGWAEEEDRNSEAREMSAHPITRQSLLQRSLRSQNLKFSRSMQTIASSLLHGATPLPEEPGRAPPVPTVGRRSAASTGEVLTPPAERWGGERGGEAASADTELPERWHASREAWTLWWEPEAP